MHTRLVEVDLLGTMNGTYAVLPHSIARGGCGLIVNVVSLGGRVPVPWAAS